MRRQSAPIEARDFMKVDMDKHLKIAVFIDFDNIEIGVKSTLQREFDVSVVLEALKERGEIITKIAYANWGKLENSTRQLSEYAVQMVQRDPSPRGDKNGADINLALDALELAFTHDHINAYCIVSGDSDFIALVNKLKQYDKTIFVVGGKAFTSTILQKNCHEFISYESMLDDSRPARPAMQQRPAEAQQHRPAEAQGAQGERQGEQRQALPAGQHQGQRPHESRQQGQHQRRPVLDLHQAMPLVERALQVLERREVRPQLGLLKSTMLQLDSTFSERAYGAGSFTDFIERLRKGDLIQVTGGEGRYMIQRKRNGAPEKTIRPDEALPFLRDVLENHRLEMEEGSTAEELEGWVKEESPNFDWKNFGFQEFGEYLNFAQDKTVVRTVPDESQGLLVYLGAEFHPPAVAEPEPAPMPEEIDEEQDEAQPVVPGQPTADAPRVKKGTRKTAAPGSEVDGNVVAAPRRPRKAAAPRKRKAPAA
ncbi:MAG: NYN domain-containing protein [Terriglobia bacterium]